MVPNSSFSLTPHLWGGTSAVYSLALRSGAETAAVDERLYLLGVWWEFPIWRNWRWWKAPPFGNRLLERREEGAAGSAWQAEIAWEMLSFWSRQREGDLREGLIFKNNHCEWNLGNRKRWPKNILESLLYDVMHGSSLLLPSRLQWSSMRFSRF